MKKFLLFIFTFLYLGIATGANLSYSYCMGRLVDVSMTKEHSHAECPICKDSNHQNDCCSNEEEFVKLSVDQTLSAVVSPAFTPMVIALLYNLNDQFLLSEASAHPVFYGDDSPQTLSDTPLFIRDCVFLI